MGVEVRTEGELVSVRLSGRIELNRKGLDWADFVRTVAEREGKPVLLLCKLEPGLELPVTLLAAGARQTVSILPLIRAVALVASGERERAMLRASVMAVNPAYPVQFFDGREAALAWLGKFAQSKKRAPAA